MECHTGEGGVTVFLVDPPLAPPPGLTRLFKQKTSNPTKLHSLDQTAERSCYRHVGGWQNLEPKQLKHLTVLQLGLVPPLHQQSAVFVLHDDLISVAGARGAGWPFCCG